MKSSAKESFDKLDVKKNLGMDYYQFETHVRDLVMDLIQPTIQKASEDHSVVNELQNGYEGLKQKLDQIIFDTNKFLKKAVSLSEFNQRVLEIERNIIKSTETLHTDFKKMTSNYDVIKDKLTIVQTDLIQFNKVNSTFQSELDQVYKYCDEQKQHILDEFLKYNDQHHQDLVNLKKKLHHIEDDIRLCKHVNEQHTMFNREYEIRMGIFQNNQHELFGEEAVKIREDIKKQMQEFDLKLLKQRIDTSDEMQQVLKASREELLRAFRKEYHSKRVSKGAQTISLDANLKQQDHIVHVEILPVVDIRVLDYDKELVARRATSGRRPRRAALPRTNTPPPKKHTNYHLLPWRVCLTDSQKSLHPTPSEHLEHIVENTYLPKHREQLREKAEQKLKEEQLEKARLEAAENKTMEELVHEAESMKKDELWQIYFARGQDPELQLIEEEEMEIQAFYERLFPPELVKQGMPDFARHLKLISEGKWKPEDLLKLEVNQETLPHFYQPSPPSTHTNLHQPTAAPHPPLSHDPLHNPPPPIQTFTLTKPHEQLPQPPPTSHATLPESLKQHNYLQLFEYLQDGLLQLRDEMTVKLNDQLNQLEHKHNKQMEQLGGGTGNSNPNKLSVPGQYGKSMSRGPVELFSNAFSRSSGIGLPNGDPQQNSGGNLSSLHHAESGGSALAGQSKDINLPFLLDQAAQQATDRSRKELVLSLQDQLRRAQARVIAHVRMETRNLLKLWSLRMRKEVVQWLNKAHGDMDEHVQYIKRVDERGKQCEDKQFEQLEVLQRQMRVLEDKFKQLGEQQNRILFGGSQGFGSGARSSDAGGNEESELNMGATINEEDNDDYFEDHTSSNQDGGRNHQLDKFSSLQSQQLHQQQYQNNHQHRRDSISRKESVISTQTQNNNIFQQPVSSLSLLTSPLLPPQQQQESQQQLLQHQDSFGQRNNNNQYSSQSTIIHNQSMIIPQSIHNSQKTAIIREEPPPTPVNLPEGFMMSPQSKEVIERQETFNGQSINNQIQKQLTIKTNDQQPQQPLTQQPSSYLKQEIVIHIQPQPAAPVQQQQQSQRSDVQGPPQSPSKTPTPRIPSPGGQRSPAASPFRREPTTTFKIQPGASGGSPNIVIASFKKTANVVQSNVRLNLEAEKKQLQDIEDPKAREMINKQKKKVQVMEMQLMALMTQFKNIDAKWKDMEEFKLKDMIQGYFEEQVAILNLDKVKEDFQDFFLKMQKLENQMSEKMLKVDMLYEQVEAGFTRNARDRSDYLVHYERMCTATESQLGFFRESLGDAQNKIEKLSTCLLSIVNEEEAHRLQGDSSQQYIRVEMPQQFQHHETEASETALNKKQPYDSSQSQLASESAVPRRNLDTGRFKNISELAKEIDIQSTKNKTSMAAFFLDQKKPQQVQKPTVAQGVLLPQLSRGNTVVLQNIVAAQTPGSVRVGAQSILGETKYNAFQQAANNAVGGDSSSKFAQHKLHYTELVDHALINSINNTIDIKNPPTYLSNSQNPMVRSSVNGVVSHRIKNLLGHNTIGGNQQQLFSNYSQKLLSPTHNSNGNTADQQQAALRAHAMSVIDYAIAGANNANEDMLSSVKLHRKKHNFSSARKEMPLSTTHGGMSSMARLSKNEFNFENLKNHHHALATQKQRGFSQLEHYKLQKHLVLNTGNPQATTQAYNQQQDPSASSPLMLQALVGTHSSKDTLIAQQQQQIKRVKNYNISPFQVGGDTNTMRHRQLSDVASTQRNQSPRDQAC